MERARRAPRCVGLLFGVLAVLLAACGGTAPADQAPTGSPPPSVVPTVTETSAAIGVTAGSEVLKDQAYAPPEPAASQGHLLDVYLPQRSGRAVPVLLWSHGSGWLQENGREGADVVAAKLNPLGIAVAGVAIRSSANAQFPGQLYDIKAAIRYLKSNAGRYGLDPERFAVMGESSGGWTAAMAGVTGNVPELEGEVGVTGPSSRVAAAVPFYPPTDFLQMDAHMIDCAYFDDLFHIVGCHNGAQSPESLLMGCQITTCPDKVSKALPVTYVDRDDPPMLILHGTNDKLVPHHQGELLFGAVQKACGNATFVSIPDGEHGAWEQWLDGRVKPDGTSAMTTGACQTSTQPSAPSWDTVIAFLQRTLLA